MSVKEVVGRPIAVASTGERLDDFDLFHPNRMADRILGMGDVLSLIEQAERTMDRDAVEHSANRMLEGRFTLEDFLQQLQQVKKLGSLGGVLKLLPGMSKEMRQAAGQIDDREIDRVEAIVRSMTPAERQDPSIIDGSRRVRVARGCGRTTQEVNALLKQFREMQKMMKGFGAGGLPGGGGGGGGMGKLAGMFGARGSAALAGARGAELSEMLASAGGSGEGLDGDPRAQGALGVGAKAAAVGAARGGPKSKKKKGGRVTPPKPR